MKPRLKIILITLLCGVIVCLIDTLFDYYYFYIKGSHPESLFLDIIRHAILIMSCFLVIGVFIANLFQEREEAQKKLKRFSQKILSIREEEKKRLSGNLHDEVGSMAIALGAAFNVAEKKIVNKDYPAALKSIQQASRSLREEVEILKKMAEDIRPPNLNTAGLSGALREYFARITKQKSIKIDFDVSVDEAKIHDEMSIALYRVGQAAVTNIINHAEAKSVKIKLWQKDNHLSFSISDDGKGFDVQDLKRDIGRMRMGIQCMKERIESLRGSFTLKSTFKSPPFGI